MHHFLAIFSKFHELVQNSVFSPRSAHFVIFALGALHFMIFCIAHEFVQNSIFSARSAPSVIFAVGALIFSHFKKCTSFYKSEVFSLHWANHFLVIFSKVLEFVQNSVLSPRSARFLIFGNGALFSCFYQSGRVCTEQKFSARDNPSFVIFVLDAPLFSDFQKNSRGFPKQRCQPKNSTFCHFGTGYTTF